MFERKLLRNLDFRVLALALLFTLVGVAVIDSATATFPGGSAPYVQRQLLAAGIGLVVMILFAIIDYSDFQRWAKLFYFGHLALLAAVLVAGVESRGSTRWLQLGSIPVPQPSELAKISLIIALAAFISHREQSEWSWGDMAQGFLFVVPSATLVLLQPDLGTSIIFFALAAGMMYVAGVAGTRLLGLAVLGLGTISAALYAHLNLGFKIPLHEHQVQRLTSFLQPDVDPLGTAYQLIQSVIAIGSGRLWGKGLFGGTQNVLRFIPDKHTDFIFSVVGEELGFVGTSLIVFLFVAFMWLCLSIAMRARDRFGALLVIGVVSMWASTFFINAGMTVGIMPVTGLPLPFLSYGGSALIANFAALGLVLNVGMRRQKILF